MIRVLAAIFMILPCVSWAAPCGNRDAIVSELHDKYSERMIGGGLQKLKNGLAIMEVWASDKTGTFTILITTPTGGTCIIGSGTDFFEVKAATGSPT